MSVEIKNTTIRLNQLISLKDEQELELMKIKCVIREEKNKLAKMKLENTRNKKQQDHQDDQDDQDNLDPLPVPKKKSKQPPKRQLSKRQLSKQQLAESKPKKEYVDF